MRCRAIRCFARLITNMYLWLAAEKLYGPYEKIYIYHFTERCTRFYACNKATRGSIILVLSFVNSIAVIYQVVQGYLQLLPRRSAGHSTAVGRRTADLCDVYTCARLLIRLSDNSSAPHRATGSSTPRCLKVKLLFVRYFRLIPNITSADLPPGERRHSQLSGNIPQDSRRLERDVRKFSQRRETRCETAETRYARPYRVLVSDESLRVRWKNFDGIDLYVDSSHTIKTAPRRHPFSFSLSNERRVWKTLQ